MKRNNMLMLAYICVIFLCAFVKLFIDYATWNAIVAAVTCSSVFFAIADYVLSIADGINNEVRIGLEFTDDILYLSKKIQSECIRSIDELEKVSTENIAVQEQKKRILSIFHDFTTEMRGEYEKRKLKTREKDNKIKKYKVTANVITAIGFFISLSFLIFPSIEQMIAPALDIISVLSFAGILLSQYFSMLQKEKCSDMARKYEQIYACWENILKEIEGGI